MITSPGSVPLADGLEVRPFRALTYRRRDPDFLARVSSPAYDLVTADGRERLAAADPHNIVRLILPRVDAPGGGREPGAAGSSAELAARTLEGWLAAGVLELGTTGLWLYEMTPTDGTPATTGWLGAVALPGPGSTAVLPHEDTFAPAVEGRRALLAATRTDLEPIVLAHDPDPRLTELGARSGRGTPDLEVSDAEGVRHRLWHVADPGVLAEVTAALRGVRAVIADGHHRFAAARAHARTAGSQPGSDAVLALVTSSGDGGLRVEAIHRVVPDLALADAVEAAARSFAVTDLPVDGSPQATAAAWLAAAPPQAFLISDGRRLVAVDRPSDAALAAIPREAAPAWRALDVVLAHHGLLEHVWKVPDDPGSLLIAHDLPTALDSARQRAGTAVLLRAPSPRDVAAVARAGARMPRKSTLFVPKPRTGLVLRPHA